MDRVLVAFFSVLAVLAALPKGSCLAEEAEEAKVEGLVAPASSVKEIAEAQKALAGGDIDTAKKVLRPLSLSGDETSHEATLRLAQVYYQEGNLRDAQSLCEKATQQTVSRYLAQTYCLLGDIYETQEKTEEALLGYLRVCLLFPTSKFRPEALFKAAGCFETLGEQDRADELRRELKRDFPNSPYTGRLRDGQTKEKEGEGG